MRNNRFLQSVAQGVVRLSMVALAALFACLLGVVGLLAFWSHPGWRMPVRRHSRAPLPDSISKSSSTSMARAKD